MRWLWITRARGSTTTRAGTGWPHFHRPRGICTTGGAGDVRLLFRAQGGREAARAGSGPANGSFADSCLTTWLPRLGIASYGRSGAVSSRRSHPSSSLALIPVSKVPLVSLQDVRNARVTIGDRLLRTPLVRSLFLSAETGA